MKLPSYGRPPGDTTAELANNALNREEELTSILAGAEMAFDNFVTAARIRLFPTHCSPRCG